MTQTQTQTARTARTGSVLGRLPRACSARMSQQVRPAAEPLPAPVPQVELVLDDGARIAQAMSQLLQHRDQFPSLVPPLRRLMDLARQCDLISLYEEIWEVHRREIDCGEAFKGQGMLA